MSNTTMTEPSRKSVYVLPLEKLRLSDASTAGSKNAALGEMIGHLTSMGVCIPAGFAITAEAFRDFLLESSEGKVPLEQRIVARLDSLNVDDVHALAQAGAEVRQWMMDAPFPAVLREKIVSAHQALIADSSSEVSFAVRSSPITDETSEILFTDRQLSFMNVAGIDHLLEAVKRIFASLYDDRVIAWRIRKELPHAGITLAACIQRMVRSDIAVAGVMFTVDADSGFTDVVSVASSYGLGETVVRGVVNPDQFYVHKPMLEQRKLPIIRRNIGSKLSKMIFAENTKPEFSVRLADVPAEQRNRYSLSDDDVVELARQALQIEKHFGQPMVIEWGKDGNDGKLYILQARHLVVPAQHKMTDARHARQKEMVLASGSAIGHKVSVGPVRVVRDASEMARVKNGDVLVMEQTDSEWESVMKRASAIITNRGGRTCHAAIVARELGIPAVIGCGNATEILKNGMLVTVSCAEGDIGHVYDGLLDRAVGNIASEALPPLPVKIMMNVGDPQLAFGLQAMPNDGVGLARLEFIINNNIGVHPKAVLDYPNIDSDLKQAVESIARGHASPRAFYVDKLAEGVATIAAAFWPKPVIVRLSDFKSNEYEKLIGGSRYEPDEENPILGFRGAARYLADEFAEAFKMECTAIKRVRNDMGLTNVEIMVPFVRTLGQAEKVVTLLARNGLQRGEDGLRIHMMCEVPSNALLAEQFLEFFDGFSIGSNDLAQLTLGLDRDSGMTLLTDDFDERDPAVLTMLSMAIAACREKGKFVSICGDAPSDRHDLAAWLMKEGIVSISLNPDALIDTWQALASTL